MPYSRSKWGKHKVLAASPTLAGALPATQPLGKSAFQSLLEQYGAVIVKPSWSWGGDGVMKVSSHENGTCTVQSGKKKTTKSGWAAAYALVRSKAGRKSHIVQQCIPLAAINGRPFDLRVMVQRRRGGAKWKVTGKLAKVAGSGYIITNVARSRGKVTTVTSAIRRSNIQGASADSILQNINGIALHATRRFHRHYRWIRTVGLDIGLDAAGRVWIIEGNFMPSLPLFRKLRDKRYYRRILAYAGSRR